MGKEGEGHNYDGWNDGCTNDVKSFASADHRDRHGQIVAELSYNYGKE